MGPYGIGVVDPYKYNGKEWSEVLGLGWYFYGFRMHDPAIGRFTGVVSGIYGSDFAKEIGDFYERINPNNPIEISYRDLINNGYGREFGKSSKFDFSSTGGIANFLNKAANYVDQSFGLNSSGTPFNPESQIVKDIYNAINK